MLVRSPVTMMPVLVGPVAGVTVTVKRVVSPGSGPDGFAEPAAESEPPALHTFVAEALLRGTGETTVKSELLLSVSVHPPAFLSAAVVFVSAAVEVVSWQAEEP